MKKLCITLLSLLFLALFNPQTTHADEKFDINSKSTYVFNSQGEASVTQEVDIINKTQYLYAPTYTIKLDIENVGEMIVTNTDGQSIPFTTNDIETGKEIKVVFPERTVGKGKQSSFVLKYKTDKLVSSLGDSKEINIPGIKDDTKYKTYTAEVITPKSWGKASIQKPQSGKKSTPNHYYFDKKTLTPAGALLIFGEEELYNLTLSYDLSNKNLFPLRTEIALPPQTGYQEVLYKDISPKPQKVYKDTDGNYMAQYQLAPQETITVTANILVKTKSNPQKQEVLSSQMRSEYLKPKQFWETRSGKVQEAARTTKTPQEIYDFVTTSLKYNYEKASKGNPRLGAAETLKNTDYVVCLEFTDLFVAIARASGIPARSVEGYAYTTTKNKPLTKVGDILHAWPEYYDDQKKMWVMVDPTWGNTTGLDYANTLDLAHITFVRKGLDTLYPVPPGGYKEDSKKQQIKVVFAKPSDFEKVEKLSVGAKATPLPLPFLNPKATVTITNSGNTPVLDKTLIVSDNDNKSEIKIEEIPPYGQLEVEVDISGNALTQTSHTLTMQIDNVKGTKDITVGMKKEELITMGGGVAIAALILACSFKAGSLLIQRRKR